MAGFMDFVKNAFGILDDFDDFQQFLAREHSELDTIRSTLKRDVDSFNAMLQDVAASTTRSELAAAPISELKKISRTLVAVRESLQKNVVQIQRATSGLAYGRHQAELGSDFKALKEAHLSALKQVDEAANKADLFLTAGAGEGVKTFGLAITSYFVGLAGALAVILQRNALVRDKLQRTANWILKEQAKADDIERV